MPIPARAVGNHIRHIPQRVECRGEAHAVFEGLPETEVPLETESSHLPLSVGVEEYSRLCIRILRPMERSGLEVGSEHGLPIAFRWLGAFHIGGVHQPLLR